MRIIIFYSSTYNGNTRKIAEEIAKVMRGRLIDIDSCGEIVPDVDSYDLIGLGSGINFASHSIQLLQFTRTLNLCGKNVFIFSTRCRPYLGGYHNALKELVTDLGGNIVCEFSCKGYDATGPWVLINGINKCHPNEKDCFNARLFAERIIYQNHPLASADKSSIITTNEDSCIGCGKCVEICPMNLLIVNEGKVKSGNERNCIQCGLCMKECPTDTIYIRKSFGNGIRIAIREARCTALQMSYSRNYNLSQK